MVTIDVLFSNNNIWATHSILYILGSLEPCQQCTAHTASELKVARLDMVLFTISGDHITKPFVLESAQSPSYTTFANHPNFPSLRLAAPMSSSNQTASPSTDSFSSIFNAALNEYQRLTKKSLDTHPFAAQLDTCQNPEAISILFRTQAQAFSKFREGDERLLACLDPTIHILSTFSDTLGEGIGVVCNPR